MIVKRSVVVSNKYDCSEDFAHLKSSWLLNVFVFFVVFNVCIITISPGAKLYISGSLSGLSASVDNFAASKWFWSIGSVLNPCASFIAIGLVMKGL